MSKRDKLRRKLRNNPKDATMQEVETLLIYFGFALVRIQGSHHIYEYDDGKSIYRITIPLHGRKVNKFYVKRAVAILDNALPEDTAGEDEMAQGENDDE